MSASLTPVDTGLAWAVKDSFLRYIAAAPSGNITISDGAAVTSTGQFYFPFAGATTSSDGALRLRFIGAVLFRAHHGFLSVALQRPCITITPTITTLSVDTGNGGLTVADLKLPERVSGQAITMWLDAEAALSESAVDLFGGSYLPGEQLAALTIRVPCSSLPSAGNSPEPALPHTLPT